MASNRTKFTVGLFLICGTVLAVAAIIYIGMSGVLESGKNYVIYFDESVQGLDKDSPVKYRGVSIGRVNSIEVAPDGNLVQVIIAVDPTKIPKQRVIAQLKNVGITGLMFIELDRDTPGDAQYNTISLSFSAPYPVIPSRPSEIKQIFAGVEKVIKRVDSIDFEGISLAIKTDLEDLGKAINDADVKGISDRVILAMDRVNQILDPEKWDAIVASIQNSGNQLQDGLYEARQVIGQVDATVAQVQQILEENRAGIRGSVDQLHQALAKANQAAGEGDVLISNTEDRLAELTRYLTVSVQNLELATQNLNRLMESVASDPGQLILGDPPKPRKNFKP